MAETRNNDNDSGDEGLSGSAQVAGAATNPLDVNRQKITSRAENICGHCMKKCTKTGKSSLAMKCDYCHYWFHAECEGLTPEQYQQLSQLASVIPNLNYYCVFGHCKQVSAEMLKLLDPTVRKVEENSKRIEVLEKKCQEQFGEIDAKIVKEVKENTEDLIDCKVKEVWEIEKE